MRFCFLSEGDTRPGYTHYHRYFELVDEVLLAEKVGFDMFGVSEQHLAIGGATTSAPEVIYSYLMALTSRIRFVYAVVLVPFRFNHPIRIAERLATQDILSNGRVECAFGRGNTMLSLRAFEVAPEETREQQDEGIALVQATFLNDPFSFVGKYFKVPPRSLVPRWVQDPHPPLWLAATSPDSHVGAAQKGLGVVSFANFMGLDGVAERLRTYDDAFDAATHGHPATSRKALLVLGHCAETTKQARSEAAPAVEYVKLAVDAYDRLSTTDESYNYMREIKKHTDNVRDDVDYMLDGSGSFVVGDPDECVRRIREFEEIGVQDLWIRLDSLPHDQLMRSIELFGKHVIPRFKSPNVIVRPPEDVIADIRRMRGPHEEHLARFIQERDEVQAT